MCHHDVYMLIHMCPTSSHHNTVSTNTLGTLTTVLNLWCFWGQFWLVHIQHWLYPLLIFHQCPDLLHLHFSAKQHGLQTHYWQLLHPHASLRLHLVPVHNNQQLLSTFALYRANWQWVHSHIWLCPGRVCRWGSRDDYQCVGRARSVHVNIMKEFIHWVCPPWLSTLVPS